MPGLNSTMKTIRIVLALLVLSACSLTLPAETVNILKAGGRNDGKFINTQVIEGAIKRLAEAGGGTLFFPAGTYLTGPITLRSNITLDIESGATLSFIDDFDAYMPYVTVRYEGVVLKTFHPLIYAYEAENITLKGGGTLEGNGQSWWNETWRIEGAVRSGEPMQLTKYQQAFDEANADLTLEPQSDWKNTLARKFFRPPFIQLFKCRNIRIEGLHLQNSPFWTVNPEFCDNLTITGLTINNPHSPNTDGINPSSCSNVHISACHISVGDDCITLKSGRDLQGRQYGVPCENITITNCTMLNGHGGVVIGSEMSGDVRKVTISNCVFDGTDRGIRIKSVRGRGGIVEEIRVDNVVMKNIGGEAFILTLFYGNVPPEPVSDRTPIFRNIHISNVTGSAVRSVGQIRGIDEMPVSDVSLSNIHIDAQTGFTVQDARNITLSQLTVNTESGPVLDIKETSELRLTDVRTLKPLADAPVIALTDVQDAYVTGCFPVAGSQCFLKQSGAQSCGIVLQGNWLKRLEEAVLAEYPEAVTVE